MADRMDSLLDPFREEWGLGFNMGVASHNREMRGAGDLVDGAERALHAAQSRGGDQIEFDGKASNDMPYFTEDTFAFLADLAAHNDREWFKAQKARYEDTVKGPAIQFILDFGPRLRSVSPHFRADPRPNGGSLFRIYRDTRFSRDKSPFKRHAGIQFRHDAGKDAHAPGFYLHVEPGACFVGLGSWRPGGKALRKIRQGLVEDPRGWNRAVAGDEFRERFELSGDSLKRPPRGFDPEHPLVEDLKRKDFIAVSTLPDEAVRDPSFLDDFTSLCRIGAPFMAFLCTTLELPF